MTSLGATPLIALFLAVAATSALCGFVASTLTKRKNRRTRRVFVIGVFCGLLAGEFVHSRRRTLRALSPSWSARSHRGWLRRS